MNWFWTKVLKILQALLIDSGLYLAHFIPLTPGENNREGISVSDSRMAKMEVNGHQTLKYAPERKYLVPVLRDVSNKVLSGLFAESLIPPSFQLYWLGLAPRLTAVCSITLLCNFTCRYLTPCLIRLSPMPSCTCPGRRAVTPSPLLAARGP